MFIVYDIYSAATNSGEMTCLAQSTAYNKVFVELLPCYLYNLVTRYFPQSLLMPSSDAIQNLLIRIICIVCMYVCTIYDVRLIKTINRPRLQFHGQRRLQASPLGHIMKLSAVRGLLRGLCVSGARLSN